MKQIISGFECIVLSEETTQSKAILCPERGGILIQLTLHGEEILFLNKETFADVSKNIRGGNPVLFPICGPLPNNEYTMNGQTYTMRQHGFARNKAWEVVEYSASKATLQLKDDEETRAQYPFAFCLQFTYELKDGKLRIHQTYENLSSEEMPFYAGFHPYFIGNHSKSTYQIQAPRYWDYSDDKTKPYTCKLNEQQIFDSKLFSGVTGSEASFKDSRYELQVRYSNHFKWIVVWSEQSDEYICLEPWMAGPLGFDNNPDIVRLPAREKLQAECSFALVK